MIYKSILLMVVFLTGQLVIPSYAVSPEQITPGESPFQHGFTDIKFLDAYFGNPNHKIEVEPATIMFHLLLYFQMLVQKISQA